jgi:hypothetical protein
MAMFLEPTKGFGGVENVENEACAWQISKSEITVVAPLLLHSTALVRGFLVHDHVDNSTLLGHAW